MVDYTEQYDQDPKKIGGNIIKGKWFFEYEMEDLLRRAEFNGEEVVWMFEIDAAYRTGEENDYTVVLAYCYLDGMIWLRDRLKVKKIITDIIPIIKEWVERNGYSDSSEIHIEPAGRGIDLVPLMIKYTEMNVIESYKPVKDKLSMVYSILTFLKSRRCGRPKGALWWDDFVKECELFPNGTHDDQVDTLVMAVKNGETSRGILASGST